MYDVERSRGVRASATLSALVVPTLVLRGELDQARARLDAVYAGERPDNLPLLKLGEADLVLAEADAAAVSALAGELRDLAVESGALYLVPTAFRLEGRSEESAVGYDAVGMAVHAAVARLDAAEAGADPDLLKTARGPLERAGFRRELERVERLRVAGGR